jgi:hypothetical protein
LPHLHPNRHPIPSHPTPVRVRSRGSRLHRDRHDLSAERAPGLPAC